MHGVEAKRRHIRFAFEGAAEIMTTDGAPRLTGTILDLSREGYLVLLTEPAVLAESARVTVTFRLNRQQFQLAGTVRSQRNDTRIGIRFDSTNTKMGGQLGTLSASRTAGWEGRSRLEQALRSSGKSKAAETDAATVEVGPGVVEPDPDTNDAQSGS